MRVECERCHALVAADLEVDADGVTVSCGACGGSFRAAARRRSAMVGDAVGDAPGCVKCGAPMTADPACPRCGLARTRAASWAAADPPAPELATAWAATVAAWDQPAAHDRVAALALDLAALPWLARRYHEVQRTRPTDAVARTRIDRIGVMTLAALKATAAVPPAGLSSRRAGSWVVIILVLLVGAGLLAARTSTQQRRTQRRPAIPAADRASTAHDGPPSIERVAPGR